jgi:hypothetical protein
MKRFDQDHPDDHPPAGMPLPSAERPKFPVKPVPVMLAEGSKERTAAIRQLSPPPKATFFVPQKPAVTPPKSRQVSPPQKPTFIPPQKPAADPSPKPSAIRHTLAAGAIRQARPSPPVSLPVAESDEDAEGDDEPASYKKPAPPAPSPPAPSLKKKTMTDEDWDESEEDERDRRKRKEKSRDEPVPAPKTSKKKKSTLPEDESEETDEEVRMARRRQKGKGREVDVEPVPETKRQVGDGRWKRPDVKSTGEVRPHPCKRCVKSGRPCLKQSGGLIACVDCARVKMKCEPMSGELPATQPAPVKPSKTVFRPGTLTQPTGAASAPKRSAKKSAPKRPAPPATGEPPKKRLKAAPAASGSKKKTIVSPDMVPTSSDEESEPAPAAPRPQKKTKNRVAKPSHEEPAPASTRLKPQEPAPAPVSEDESSGEIPQPADPPANRRQHSHWPGGRRNFEEFEAYYRKFYKPLSIKYINTTLLDIRLAKAEHDTTRLGFAFTELNASMMNVEGQMVRRMDRLEEKIQGLEETCEEADELRESLVASEGEVSVLRERVDQQDTTIRHLEGKIDRALKLILELSSVVTSESFFTFYLLDFYFFRTRTIEAPTRRNNQPRRRFPPPFTKTTK